MTREFALHVQKTTQTSTESLVYFFEKLALSFAENVPNDDELTQQATNSSHDELSTKHLSIFHYNLVYDCLLKQHNQLINVMSDDNDDENCGKRLSTTVLFDMLRTSERAGRCGRALEKLTGLVQECVLKDLVEKVLDSNELDIRKRLSN